jgi:hypothetical protein
MGKAVEAESRTTSADENDADGFLSFEKQQTLWEYGGADAGCAGISSGCPDTALHPIPGIDGPCAINHSAIAASDSNGSGWQW